MNIIDVQREKERCIAVLFTHLQMKVKQLYNELIKYLAYSFNYALMEVSNLDRVFDHLSRTYI